MPARRRFASRRTLLAHELPDLSRLYPGHGPAGSAAMLDWEAGYLTRYRAEVDTLRAGSEHLSDADKQTLDARLTAAYPGAGLEFMISLGADSVASELWHAERKAGEQ